MTRALLLVTAVRRILTAERFRSQQVGEGNLSRIYFTADLHLGHELVAQHRGYSDVSRHDDGIVQALIETVLEHSTLWILGDVMGWGSHRDYALSRLLEVRSETGTAMHLVPGNHDTCHPLHRNAHKEQSKYLDVFDSVQPFAKIRHNRRDVLLSHFPYEGDHTVEERFNQWRLRDYGQPLIHGHTHQTTPTEVTRPNQVCVSWDAWAKPAKLHEVMAALEITCDQEAPGNPDAAAVDDGTGT